MIINWEKYEATLSSLNLDYWCDIIIDIKLSFLSLDFRHIYREHNKSAHRLSKKALSLKAGLLSFLKLLEGEIIGERLIQLF